MFQLFMIRMKENKEEIRRKMDQMVKKIDQNAKKIDETVKKIYENAKKIDETGEMEEINELEYYNNIKNK